jgi:hypothetical protein
VTEFVELFHVADGAVREQDDHPAFTPPDGSPQVGHDLRYAPGHL